MDMNREDLGALLMFIDERLGDYDIDDIINELIVISENAWLVGQE